MAIKIDLLSRDSHVGWTGTSTLVLHAGTLVERPSQYSETMRQSLTTAASYESQINTPDRLRPG
jgi:hypothetical protein